MSNYLKSTAGILFNVTAKDITEAVLFLADDERSGWITGTILPVDDGVAAGRN